MNHRISARNIRRWCCFIPLVFLGASGQNTVPARGFDVKHYLISMEIPDPRIEYVQGNTDIQLQVTEGDLSAVVLDFQGLMVDSVWIDEVPVTDYDYNRRNLKINLSPSRQKDEMLMVTVFYHGTPLVDPVWGGFYFEGGEVFNMGVGFSSDPPSLGRFWYPCVDDFNDKATHEYLIRVDKELTAVCSGTLKEIYSHPDHTHTFHWEINSEIPTYLSSVAISRYVSISGTLDGILGPIPYSIYVTPGEREKALVSFSTLPVMLKAFELHFGPYRWERIGFVSVPFRGGAMEHATNISLSRRTITGTNEYESLFAHEFAHNWFGNLVTCTSTSDMWLNEGLASWAEALYFEYKHGKDAYNEYMRQNHYRVIRETHLSDNGFYAIYDPPREVVYGSTVYDKGADAAHALRGYIGDEKFFPALRKYFRKYAFGNISTGTFLSFLENTTHTPMTDFGDAWIYTKGFPHFSVDSVQVSSSGEVYQVRVFIRQRLRERDVYARSNRLEIQFMDIHWNSAVRTFSFSGESAVKEFYLPFRPVLAMIDPDEKVPDATLDKCIRIRTTGKYDFVHEDAEIHVSSLSDSAMIRVTSHWVRPDFDPVLKAEPQAISIPDHYWTIELLEGGGMEAGAVFTLDRATRFNGYSKTNLALMRARGRFQMFFRDAHTNRWVLTGVQMEWKGDSLKFFVPRISAGDYLVLYTRHAQSN